MFNIILSSFFSSEKYPCSFLVILNYVRFDITKSFSIFLITQYQFLKKRFLIKKSVYLSKKNGEGNDTFFLTVCNRSYEQRVYIIGNHVSYLKTRVRLLALRSSPFLGQEAIFLFTTIHLILVNDHRLHHRSHTQLELLIFMLKLKHSPLRYANVHK